MKLSKHQKEIIKKIIAGEVFDIQSYLRVFNKCHTEKYDMDSLKAAFDLSEEGKTYKVIKEGYSIFEKSQGQIAGISMPFSHVRLNIPENEYELKPATFVDNAPTIKCTYDEKEYEFDFCKGVDVISCFDDVLEFLTLWYYLKQEGLVLEVNKPLLDTDIGLFLKKIDKEKSQKKPEIEITYEGKKYTPIGTCDVELTAPKRFACEYSTVTWELDQENLLICKDYFGKKIVRTSALITYATKKFKTKEQVSQDNNFRVALIALFISVLSIVMSNIIPLFQKQPSDYLEDISQQLVVIESHLSNLEETVQNQSHSMESEVEEILLSIENIKSTIQNYQNENTSPNFEAILQQLEEIKQSLSKTEP